MNLLVGCRSVESLLSAWIQQLWRQAQHDERVLCLFGNLINDGGQGREERKGKWRFLSAQVRIVLHTTAQESNGVVTLHVEPDECRDPFAI